MAFDYIKSDLYRYRGDTSLKSFIKEYIRNSGFRYMVAFRLRKDKGIYKYMGYFLWLFRNKSIIIPIEAEIGYGLYIGHNGPVIINATARIGNNCNLSQYLTIGSSEGHAAHIGNNVFLGPNVCVVEDVAISDNVTIGAGSVVVTDIPANATAAGNYAKVLNYDKPARYIKNMWSDKR